MKAFITLILMTMFVSCGTDTGRCALNCSNATFIGAPADFTSKWQTGVGNIQCTAGSQNATINPIRLEFQITNNEFALDGKAAPGTYLMFDPKVTGGIGLSKEAAEAAGNTVEQADGTYFPSTYFGVATKSNEWCTDECGVGTLHIVPQCPPAGTEAPISIGAQSGRWFMDTLLEMTISTDEVEDNPEVGDE